MAKYLLCKWIGNRRRVPGVGTLSKNDKQYFREDVAKDLARQRLVALPRRRKPKTAKKGT
jgi:hypothetical protein